MTLDETLNSAKELYRQARFTDEIELLESSLSGPMDDEQLQTRARLYVELSRVKRTLGRYSECELAVETALRLASQMSAAPPELTVEIWNEQGQLCDPLAKHVEALAILGKALDTARTSLTPIHILTAEVLTNLSLAHLRVGEANRATATAQEAQALCRASVGEMDEKYASAIEHLGLALGQAGKLNEPEPLHRKALEIREACFGPNHPELAFSLLNIAASLQAQGLTAGVEDLMKSAVEIFRKGYGDGNTVTSMAVNNLGGFYLEQSNFKAAAAQFELALEMKERALGKENPGLRNVLRNLGIAYEGLGKKSESKECLNRAGSLMEQMAPSELNVDILVQTGSDLFSQGKKKEGFEVLTRALATSEREHGTDSAKSATVLKVLGSACVDEDPEQAKTYFIRAVRILKREFGTLHPRLAEMLHLLSMCFLLQGDQTTFNLIEQQAKYIEHSSGLESADEKAVTAMMEKMSGDKDARFMASMLKFVGKVEEADALTEEYLLTKEAEGGTAFAKELMMMASEEMGARRLDKAVEYLQKSIDILRELPAEAEDLVDGLLLMNRVRCDLEQYDEARIVCQHALELRESIDGPNHWALANVLNSLKFVEEKAGDQEAVDRLARRIDELPQPDPLEQQDRFEKRMEASMKDLLQPLLKMLESIAPPSEGSTQIAEETS